MNYYNPYFYTMPSNLVSAAPKVGLLSRLFGGRNITFGSILSGTQKTLGTINQIIPIVKQARPLMSNAKTMFKVMNEFKRFDSSPAKTNSFRKKETIVKNNITEELVSEKKETQNYESNEYFNGPTFFI